MPTPWDYQRDTKAAGEGPAPSADNSMIPGPGEDRLQESARTGDPIELARQAEQSAQAFLELQNHLQNSLDTIGSRPPGAGFMGQSIEAEKDHPLAGNDKQ